MEKNYDFSGWATRNDLKCSDGRIIRKDAFKHNDGQTVPLVWNHRHDDPLNVLGHAVLENREQGVYTYGFFNDTVAGQDAKKLVQHGDVGALSIYANQLKQDGRDVLHGAIKEVSLVLAGANPGAYIDSVLYHGENVEDEGIIYTDEKIMIHSEEDDEPEEKQEEVVEEQEKEEEPMEEIKHAEVEEKKTVEEVFNSLTDEQKTVVYMMIGQALKETPDEEEKEEENEEMKHNVFDTDERQENYLSHEDMETIFADAKRLGSLKDSVLMHMEEGVLAHSIPMEGMTGPSEATASQTYGFRDPDMLFPEYRSMNNPPEWIKRDTGWVQKVMGGVHHTPFSRIKSVFADITEDEARAKGYIKGKLKKDEVFTLLKRTTDPQTIYKRQKLDRDDVIDITDFDVVAWIRGEMRLMLEEEIARAILIGDGRSGASDDKISESHIRPIVSDAPLFSVPVSVPSGDTDAIMAKNFIDSAIRARKHYKGSGTPTLFTTADMHTEMLLLEDQIGHKLYKTDAELATALRVKEIVEVEVMEGQKVDNKDLLGVIVNIGDYNVGADKGGEVNMFDDFDIDYNQMKYLIETRISGALVKPFSALVLTTGAGGATGSTGV